MRKQTIWVLTQTSLYSHRRWSEAGNSGFLEISRKKRNCTICVAKIKGLISFAVTASLFSPMQIVGFPMQWLILFFFFFFFFFLM